MNRPTLTLAIIALILIGRTGQATEPEARELAKKFLAHMSANAPVAGTFEIRTIPDPAIQESLRKAARESGAKEGYGVSFGADKPELNCRWAWDGSREMLDTLSGSNVWQTFLRTPEANLQGTVRDNFNLEKPGPSSGYGPAGFYFLMGRLPWSDPLKDCKFRIEEAPTGSPAGYVSLVATSPKRTVHLVVHRAKGTLHGHRRFLPDGKLSGELMIDKVKENSDGRVFPTSARLLLYQPATGKVMQTYTLTAREVTFPASGPALEDAFRLTLSKGALISDYLLSKQIKLKSPALAADVLAGKIPGEPAEFKTTVPRTGTQSAPASDSWYFWGLALLMSLPLGIYLAYRGYKTWKLRGAD
jgi:hypothetical protein